MLRTGDLGALDGDGRLTVTGRRPETIVTGGENVAPTEVEAVLEAHPAVAEALVEGRADPQWGESVAACVVLQARRRRWPADLRAFCASGSPASRCPRRSSSCPALPRTRIGQTAAAQRVASGRGPRA